MTHDLLRNVIQDLKATVQKIVVCDLQENTFYALIYLTLNGDTVAIDARPSDAIALACGHGRRFSSRTRSSTTPRRSTSAPKSPTPSASTSGSKASIPTTSANTKCRGRRLGRSPQLAFSGPITLFVDKPGRAS